MGNGVDVGRNVSVGNGVFSTVSISEQSVAMYPSGAVTLCDTVKSLIVTAVLGSFSTIM